MPIREGERYTEVIKELAAGDCFGAQGSDVRGRLLAVDEAKSPGLQLAHETDQRDF